MRPRDSEKVEVGVAVEPKGIIICPSSGEVPLTVRASQGFEISRSGWAHARQAEFFGSSLPLFIIVIVIVDVVDAAGPNNVYIISCCAVVGDSANEHILSDF